MQLIFQERGGSNTGRMGRGKNRMKGKETGRRGRGTGKRTEKYESRTGREKNRGDGGEK